MAGPITQILSKPYRVRFAGRRPRVFVGVVAYGEVDPVILESYATWSMYVGANYHDDFEVFFGVAKKQEQYRARNSLVSEAQSLGADFILMLDDDHTPSDCPDMLAHFYTEQKPFQGGLYVARRGDKSQPVIQCYDEATGVCRWAEWDEVPVDGGPVDILGGGINWLDMALFDFVKQPHWWPYPHDRREVAFLPDEKYGLDLQLSIALKKLGVQPWLNGKVRLGHVLRERAVLRPPGITQPVRCDKCGGLANGGGGKWECIICHEEMEAA